MGPLYHHWALHIVFWALRVVDGPSTSSCGLIFAPVPLLACVVSTKTKREMKQAMTKVIARFCDTPPGSIDSEGPHPSGEGRGTWWPWDLWLGLRWGGEGMVGGKGWTNINHINSWYQIQTPLPRLVIELNLESWYHDYKNKFPIILVIFKGPQIQNFKLKYYKLVILFEKYLKVIEFPKKEQTKLPRSCSNLLSIICLDLCIM